MQLVFWYRALKVFVSGIVLTLSDYNGPVNVAEVPYMEGFICKPDVRTLSAMKSTRK